MGWPSGRFQPAPSEADAPLRTRCGRRRLVDAPSRCGGGADLPNTYRLGAARFFPPSSDSLLDPREADLWLPVPVPVSNQFRVCGVKERMMSRRPQYVSTDGGGCGAPPMAPTATTHGDCAPHTVPWDVIRPAAGRGWPSARPIGAAADAGRWPTRNRCSRQVARHPRALTLPRRTAPIRVVPLHRSLAASCWIVSPPRVHGCRVGSCGLGQIVGPMGSVGVRRRAVAAGANKQKLKLQGRTNERIKHRRPCRLSAARDAVAAGRLRGAAQARGQHEWVWRGQLDDLRGAHSGLGGAAEVFGSLRRTASELIQTGRSALGTNGALGP